MKILEKLYTSKDYKYKFIPIILGALLLLFRLNHYPFWGDEVRTLINTSKSIKEIINHFISSDIHPPLYFILSHFFIKIVSYVSQYTPIEFRIRLMSSIFAILSIFITMKISKKLQINEFISSILMATSPFLILYSRMARYYSMGTFFSLLSIYFLLKFIQENKNRVHLYITNLLTIYTFYPGIIVIVAQFLYILLEKREKIKDWLILQFFILLAYLPWLLFAFLRHITLTTHIEKNIIEQFFIKFLYPFYSFAAGETIMPYEIYASIPILVLSYYLLTKTKIKNFIMAFFFFSIFLVAIGITFIFKQVLFAFAPSRGMFIAPILFIGIADGLEKIKKRNIILIIILIINFYGIFNYWTGRNFHNPNYIAPWKEIAKYIIKNSPNKSYVLTYELGLIYYLEDNANVIQELKNIENNKVLWFCSRDRGDPYIMNEYKKLEKKLANYKKIDEKRWLKENKLYIEIKKLILRKENIPQHKIILKKYIL